MDGGISDVFTVVVQRKLRGADGLIVKRRLSVTDVNEGDTKSVINQFV